MPLPYTNIRTIIYGHLEGGNTWSVGLTANPSGAGTQADLQEYADNVADIVADWGEVVTGGLRALLGGSDGIDGVTCYWAQMNDESTLAAAGVFAPVAGSSTSQMPSQIAVVVSTHTGFLGRKNNGRMYLPCTSPTINTGQLSSAQTTAIANAAADALSAIFGVTYSGFPAPLVVGQNGNPLTTLSVDSVLDTQRRRRNQTAALYKPTVVISPD